MSRLTGPAYINIIGRKMTALIDMLEQQKYRTTISFLLQDHILKASKAFSI